MGMRLRSLTGDHWSQWHLIGAIVMAALGVAATFDAWADIYHIAVVDEEYSHIFLVPLVVAWMVWVRRARFRHCSPSGAIVGPVFVAIGWFISSYGFHHGIQSFWHGGSVLVVLGCILSVLGKNVIFRFFPAFAVLIFMVPFPGSIRQQIALPLQAWTAQIIQHLLDLVGMDVQRSGNNLVIGGMNVTVAEACNGLRMVFGLIMVAYAFSFGMPLRNSVRILLLLASPLAAIACNIVRILPTAWLYGNASHDVAEQFHDYAGWLMLPLAFLMLMSIIQLLKWAMIPVTRYTLVGQQQ
jgi:exosortase